MPTDTFYQTPEWHALRRRVIARSKGMCEAPGCWSRGVVVDHIVARSAGGADHERNLRHLCRRHDNEVKENDRGARRSGGRFKPNSACGADGLPIDPHHPFHASATQASANFAEREGGSNITTSARIKPAGRRISTKFK